MPMSIKRSLRQEWSSLRVLLVSVLKEFSSHYKSKEKYKPSKNKKNKYVIFFIFYFLNQNYQW